mmetsp:Transcript_21110/g.31080  ORF Transcript_21110/g.31080 Transcript_21110/m.31080 type:complete len:92 (+) Transcript_21110:155-430(+)
MTKNGYKLIAKHASKKRENGYPKCTDGSTINTTPPSIFLLVIDATRTKDCIILFNRSPTIVKATKPASYHHQQQNFIIPSSSSVLRLYFAD